MPERIARTIGVTTRMDPPAVYGAIRMPFRMASYCSSLTVIPNDSIWDTC